MAEVLGDLAALGYRCEWDCLPAAAFGAPHLRYRVFVLAHAASPRRAEGRRQAGGPLRHKARRTQPERLGAAVADASRQRHGVPSHALPPRRHSVKPCRWRTAEPCVGRVLDGPPAGMDGHRWPAPPGPEQYPWEPPRLVAGKEPYRRQRLQALGNAVVPQVAEWLGRRILAVEGRT